MGQTDLGAEEIRKAYELRDRVSDRERLYILMLYDRQVTGNLQKELQTLESWAQTYPRDCLRPWHYGGLGRTRAPANMKGGFKQRKRPFGSNPDIPFPYAVMAIHNLFLDRFAEAADALQRAAERKLEIPEFLVTRYYLAFLKGDQAGMEREIARAPGEHAEDWMSHNQALVLARSGRMRQARTMWERAIALAQQAGNRERAAIYEAAEAVCEAHFGNAAAAKERARAALELAKGRDVEYAAAFALALSGDSAGIAKARRRPGETLPGGYSRAIRVSSHAARAFRTRSSGAVWTRSSDCNGRFPTTSRCRAQRSLPSSEASIPPMYAARRTLQQDVARRPRRNFKKFSITAASFSPIRSAPWRTCNWAEHTLSRATGPRPKAPTRISSRSGRMPTRTSPILKQAKAEYAKLR